jgi:hypothetical protein
MNWRPSRLVAIAATAWLLTLGAPAAAQQGNTNQTIDTVLGDHTAYEPVIRAAQSAVAAHDAATLAALVRYPIKVSIDGHRTTIRSEADFIARYDSIITPEIAEAVTSENYDDLFVNYQGVMFGEGQMWIGGRCLDAGCKRVDVKVIAIQPGPKPLAPL